MKKAFVVLGIVFLVLLILGGGGFGFMAYEGTQLDKSSKAYVEEANSKIAESWSVDELKKRESPVLKRAVSDEKIDQLFQQLQQLGSLQSLEEPKGDANVSYVSPHFSFSGAGSENPVGSSTTAKYETKAVFQNGTASIDTRLICSNGEWQILSFHVDVHVNHLNFNSNPSVFVPSTPDAAAPTPTPADPSANAPAAPASAQAPTPAVQ